MIITRTPFRISFAGGGSDIPSFYQQHEGCVLSASINKYMYIMIHPTFNKNETIIKYKRIEVVDDTDRIEHPIARQILKDYCLSGVEVASVADVPAGTGLGSSSAYAVGTLHAVSAYCGKYRSQNRLAEDACTVELGKLNEPIGKQDQYGVAIGGIKFIRFLPTGEVDVTPLLLGSECKQELERNLLMFYTGGVHSASAILEEQNNNNTTSKSNYFNLVKMTELAQQLRCDLLNEDLTSFGKTLHEGWLLKRELASRISNSEINAYYDCALQHGALGGKLLGAGGGGFLLFYCEKNKQAELRSAMSDLMELDFSFDQGGSKVIHVGDL